MIGMDSNYLKAFALSFIMTVAGLKSHAQHIHSAGCTLPHAKGDKTENPDFVPHPTHEHPDSTVLFIPEYYPEFGDMVKELGKKAGIDDIEIHVMNDKSDVANISTGYGMESKKQFLWVSNADFKNFSLPALKGVVGHEIGHMILRLNKIPDDHLEEWRADSLTVEQGLANEFTLWLQEFDNIQKERITNYIARSNIHTVPGVKITNNQDTIIIDTREIDFLAPDKVEELRQKYSHNKHVVRYIDAIEDLYQTHQGRIPIEEVVNKMHHQFNQDLDKTTIHKSPVTREEEVTRIANEKAAERMIGGIKNLPDESQKAHLERFLDRMLRGPDKRQR